MVDPNRLIAGSGIYEAAGVPSRTVTSWDARGFLTAPDGSRYFPKTQQGRALSCTAVDICVLRLARELAGLGMAVRDAVAEAREHGWMVAAMLAGTAKRDGIYLAMWRDPDGGWASLTGALSRGTLADMQLSQVARLVNLSALVRTVTASIQENARHAGD